MLLPWIALSICSIFYFTFALNSGYEKQASDEEKAFWYIMGGIVLVLVIYQVYLEYLQAKDERRKYLRSFYNWSDIFQLLATFWIVVINMTGSSWPSSDF